MEEKKWNPLEAIAKPVSEEQYDLPELDKVEIDATKQQMDIVKTTPYDRMVQFYKERKIDLLQPNPKCKKGCYGRGFLGIDQQTKVGAPCPCVLPQSYKDEHKGQVNINHKIKRHLMKQKRLEIKKLLRQAVAEVAAEAPATPANIPTGINETNKDALAQLTAKPEVLTGTPEQAFPQPTILTGTQQ
jgi:hypothetical protein